MKHITIFCWLISLLSSNFLLSQELLTRHFPGDDIYQGISDNTELVDINQIKESVLFYNLNTNLLDSLLTNNVEFISCQFGFFDSEILNINMRLFNNYKHGIDLKRQTSEGIINEKYSPDFKTYKIENSTNHISGIFILSQEGVKAVFSIQDKMYQLDLLGENNNIYFICDINNSPFEHDFSCANDLLSQEMSHASHDAHRTANLFGCIDVAIEIDYYTFQTFESYQDAVDWALEILSVANIVYEEELDLRLVSSSAIVWELEDPYSSFVEEPQNMLMALRDAWNNNEGLQEMERDLVHLFSKRNDTGTGGIAFLNGVGSNFNGYGFSSGLVDVDEYVELPAPYFFWNIYCLVHELGHNFGAKHTQWCGWPGGPIDNCANIEEVLPGECSDYTNNPSPQTGTIMSYCHTWSFQSGGGIIMKFNDYVKEALMAYLGLQNLYDCENDDLIYGCLDVSSCNYNPSATVSDGECIYPNSGYDCLGNCLNDQNDNGICDEEELLLMNDIRTVDNFFMFPNPAYQFVNIRKDNLDIKGFTIKLFNSVGSLVFMQENTENNSTIDVSSISSGVYSAHLITESEIKKQTIIIQ